MLERITNHVEIFLAFAASSGLVSTGYRIWYSQATIARHHAWLVRRFEALARGEPLELMQRGVNWLLRKLDFIYGPATGEERGAPLRFLTVRAWKTSAWIAAYLLFALPLLAAAVTVIVDGFRSGGPVSWGGSAVFCGLWLFVTLIFFFAYWISRGWTPEWSLETIAIDLIEDSGRSAAYIGIPTGVLIAISANIGSVILSWAAGGLATIIGAGGLIFLFIQPIRKYGFLAPLAFAAQLTLFALLMFNLVFGIALILVDSSLSDTETSMAFILAVMSSYIVYKSFDPDAERKALPSAFLLLVVLDLVFIYIGGGQRGGDDLYKFGSGFIGAMLGIVLPYTLAIYVAVYSNSIPDWLSIAMTRHFLAKAATARSARLFLALLLADLGMAIACVVATFVIVVFVFALCGVLISLSIGLVDLGPYYQSVATFFFGGIKAVPMLGALWEGAPVRALTSAGPSSAGGFTVLLLVAISSTSLLPSLVNAATLLTLLGGRIGGFFLARPAQALHASLLTPPGADEEEQRRSFLRSSILIGIAGGILIYAVLIGLEWLLG
jgi:hypothetical protein